MTLDWGHPEGAYFSIFLAPANAVFQYCINKTELKWGKRMCNSTNYSQFPTKANKTNLNQIKPDPDSKSEQPTPPIQTEGIIKILLNNR